MKTGTHNHFHTHAHRIPQLHNDPHRLRHLRGESQMAVGPAFGTFGMSAAAAAGSGGWLGLGAVVAGEAVGVKLENLWGKKKKKKLKINSVG